MNRAPGAVLAALTLFTIALGGCGAATTTSGGAPGVITVSGAKRVLASYVTANNRANQLREASALGAYEGGSSYLLDAGTYAFDRVTDPANHNYTPFRYVRPSFYIPHQTSYPAWFAVRAQQQDVHPPASGGSAIESYLLFTRSSAKAKWLEVLSPNVLSGTAQPQVSADAQGGALPIASGDGAHLALPPRSLAAADVSYLDAGSGSAAPPRPGLPTPKPTGTVVTFANGKTNLGDLHDQAFFLGQAPGQLDVQDTHSTTSDRVYALETAGGGGLVFYDLAATLTISTIYGQLFRLKYSGFISGSQQDANFEVLYREQFVVYEPPGTPARPQVVAENSGPVAAECGGGPCT
jgi:hypothetical protein